MRKKSAKKSGAKGAASARKASSQLPKESHTQPVRAAIYARSAAEPCSAAQPWGDSDTLTPQINASKRAAADNGLTIVEGQVFIDSGVSGNSHPTSRPGLSELLRRVSTTKPFNAVICDDASRLGMNFRDVIELIQKLKENGVEVHFAADDLTGEEWCRLAAERVA